ncbi:MAG: tRNA (adenosine(37)-N6)-threonylcarbamoyltransferase complex ATPase subunit type 1 TsaE [Candidatus Woykebacteria bacterium RBG_13_40_7b]|uniref:tRNA threonylcarbamoyladenosine biosynthesis protein TsaE n=1 Tax=Candidatus Woykebacteria bacterium RBG_13_40_7b TaxID=1802594 RepID=A0A1G1WAF3_9BACT|nr:MAG: tRNA (adenosine(37)-N6)-threonylcarbamoyltransferase complex ATPase subunit type 1 TsaE [Candidatus Woykebacteria bacterium RBG_13_40_7b]
MNYLSKDAKETQKIATNFARNLKGGEILALIGNLGSGKTTFLQGLARGLGIKKRILSPSFVLIRSQPIPSHKPLTTFHHIDLYRLEGKINVKDLGLSEIFGDPTLIIAIEWAEKIKNQLPKGTIFINFEYIDETTRKIDIRR